MAIKLLYMNAYAVKREPSGPGPEARTITTGKVLGSLSFPKGNNYKKRRAMEALHRRYDGAVRCKGLIYKNPLAVAVWVFPEEDPAENWRGDDN